MAESFPIFTISGMKPWDEEPLQRRIKARAAQFGKKPSRLLKDAGFGEDLLRKPPEQGRRIDSLEKIAIALKWSLGELLGIIDPDRERTVIDPHKLEIALRLAVAVAGRNPLPQGLTKEVAVARIAADAYDAVSALERDRPEALKSEEALAVLASLLTSKLPK
jgi:hypothetical protein